MPESFLLFLCFYIFSSEFFFPYGWWLRILVSSHLLHTDATVPFISFYSFWKSCLNMEFAKQSWFHSSAPCSYLVDPAQASSVIRVITSFLPLSSVYSSVLNTVWICSATFFVSSEALTWGNQSTQFVSIDLVQETCTTNLSLGNVIDISNLFNIC